MSTDITNWLQVNIVNNPQFLQGLLALIIMILAFFLAFGKPTKKIPRRLGGMAVFVFGSFLFLYAYIAEFDRVLTVWATLILAAVAVFSFEESRRLREENRQREERERKERLLNEIIEWAIGILDIGRTRELPSAPEYIKDSILHGMKISADLLSKIYSDEVILALFFDSINLENKASYLGRMVFKLKDVKLSQSMLNTGTLLNQHRRLLSLTLKQAKVKDKKAIGRLRVKLDKSAKELIKESVRLLNI